MKLTFLGQGLESSSSNAIGYYIIKFLNSPSFNSFTGISAFASQAGIFGLSQHIENAKKKLKTLTLIVGIDQDGTSKEALEEILSLNINSYIFYQSESPIFHPKIYLFEGDSEIKLIIGSSNLTGRGLFTNVESSLLIEFNKDDIEGNALLTEFKSYYKSLFDLSDPNLFKVDNTIISNFVSMGVVPDEVTRRKIYSRKNSSIGNAIPSSDLDVPKRSTARIPSVFPAKRKKRIDNIIEFVGSNKKTSNADEFTTQSTEDNLLVWRSGPLTERDLNIPTGSKTNATGSVLLKKGQLKEIDQRHHFRDEVFSFLPWASDIKPAKAHLERATAFFHLIIEGVDCGVFPLILTHNTKTNTRSYFQRNSMTSLSWGTAKKFVANPHLINKTASIYKSSSVQTNQFVMIIE